MISLYQDELKIAEQQKGVKSYNYVLIFGAGSKFD